jgi:hypothetical protein
METPGEPHQTIGHRAEQRPLLESATVAEPLDEGPHQSIPAERAYDIVGHLLQCDISTRIGITKT